MNLAFWNLNKKDLGGELRDLVRACGLHLLILAECSLSDDEVLDAVNTGSGPDFVKDPFNGFSRIRFFYTKLELRAFSDDEEEGSHVAIRRVRLPQGGDVTLVAVHLRSKRESDVADQTVQAQRLRKKIEEAEAAAEHDRTLVLGDFNMNPFEQGLVAAEALHAVMDRRTARKCERTVQKQRRKFFFNPMWSRLGDASDGPPGTYYYVRSSQVCFFWNTFDQVLLRPSLLPACEDRDIEVMTSIGDHSLLRGDGRPDARRYSDHLPLFVRLDTARLDDYGKRRSLG